MLAQFSTAKLSVIILPVIKKEENMCVNFMRRGTLFLFCSMFIVLMAGCPMPEPNMGGGNVSPPGTMAAPTLEAGDEQLIATWTAPNNGGITGYELQYRQYSADGGTTWSDPPIEVAAPATKTIITGLTNGSSYEVQVRARNSAGTGGWSDSALASPVAVPHAPNAPGLTPENSQLTVYWTAPTSDGGSAITGYELQYRQYSSDGGTTWSDPPIEVAAPATKTIITGLSNGSSYEVQVRAINAQGAGGWSDSALASPVAVPHAPDLPSLTVENEQLRISWAAPTNTGGSDITGYDLRYALNNSPLPDEPQISNTSNTSHTIMQLEIGSRYTVQVRGINAEGRGPWSESAAKTFPLIATQVPEGTEVFVILSTVDNAIANAANPNITVVPVTSPALTVVLPTIDAATGIIMVTASTSPGTYTVSGTDGGSELFTPEEFSVTLSPPTNAALKTAVANGISNWGQTADLNYILTTAITDMSEVFKDKTAFNGNISGWTVSSVTDMSSMFHGAGAFNGNISGWTVSAVTDMSGMFNNARAFNGNISGWTVSAVTDMSEMFRGATAFNRDLNNWTVSSVTTMSNMFYFAKVFNGDISGWDVSAVTDMSGMFHNADAFNRDLNNWTVSAVTDMSEMFRDTNTFNGNISGWTVSAVTDMSGMFTSTIAFNRDLNNWTVSAVTDMSGMFANTTAFNGDISGWDVSKVTTMASMFLSAIAFNGDISGWDVSKVTTMASMFLSAIAFNGNISGWDVSSVTSMSNMFFLASAFNQNLEEWKAHWTSETGNKLDANGKYTGTKINMFTDSGLDVDTDPLTDGKQPNFPSWY